MNGAVESVQTSWFIILGCGSGQSASCSQESRGLPSIFILSISFHGGGESSDLPLILFESLKASINGGSPKDIRARIMSKEI